MNNNEFNVKLIKFEELDDLLDLYKQLNAEDSGLKRERNITELWKEILNDPFLYYLGLEKDGKIVSSCTLAVIKSLTREGRPYGFIEYVITDSRYRKRDLALQ